MKTEKELNSDDFKKWLAGYVNKDTIEGDFSKDVIDDDDFPTKSNYDEILLYLNSLGACYEVIRAFKILWKKYGTRQAM